MNKKLLNEYKVKFNKLSGVKILNESIETALEDQFLKDIINLTGAQGEKSILRRRNPLYPNAFIPVAEADFNAIRKKFISGASLSDTEKNIYQEVTNNIKNLISKGNNAKILNDAIDKYLVSLNEPLQNKLIAKNQFLKNNFDEQTAKLIDPSYKPFSPVTPPVTNLVQQLTKEELDNLDKAIGNIILTTGNDLTDQEFYNIVNQWYVKNESKLGIKPEYKDNVITQIVNTFRKSNKDVDINKFKLLWNTADETKRFQIVESFKKSVTNSKIPPPMKDKLLGLLTANYNTWKSDSGWKIAWNLYKTGCVYSAIFGIMLYANDQSEKGTTRRQLSTTFWDMISWPIAWIKTIFTNKQFGAPRKGTTIFDTGSSGNDLQNYMLGGGKSSNKGKFD